MHDSELAVIELSQGTNPSNIYLLARLNHGVSNKKMSSAAVSADFGSVMNCLFIGEQRGNNDSPYSSEEPEVDIFSPGGWACQRLGYSVDDVYHIACKDLVNSSLLVGGGLGEGGRRYYNCACPHLADSLFQDENVGTDDIFAGQKKSLTKS